MSTGGAAAVAIAVAAKRKHIYSMFRHADATTVSTAKTLTEVGLPESRMFRMLVRRSEIIKVDAERFYLDETAVFAGRKKRAMLAAGAVLIVVIVMLVMKLYAV